MKAFVDKSRLQQVRRHIYQGKQRWFLQLQNVECCAYGSVCGADDDMVQPVGRVVGSNVGDTCVSRLAFSGARSILVDRVSSQRKWLVSCRCMHVLHWVGISD